MLSMLKKHRDALLMTAVGLFSLIAVTSAQAAGPAGQLLQQSNDPVGGNPKGSVSVVEFFDYQCSHCINMATVIADIIKKNPNVRIVFKELPIRGPMSEFASRAALAANLQGKYYPFHHALLVSDQPLTPDVVYTLAKENGIDVDKLKIDMSSETVNNELAATAKLAQDLKLSGTPAFFIAKTNEKNDSNVIFFLGQMDESQLQSLINKHSK